MRKKLPETISSCFECPYFVEGHVIGFSDFKEMDKCKLGKFNFMAIKSLTNEENFPISCPLEYMDKYND